MRRRSFLSRSLCNTPSLLPSGPCLEVSGFVHPGLKSVLHPGKSSQSVYFFSHSSCLLVSFSLFTGGYFFFKKVKFQLDLTTSKNVYSLCCVGRLCCPMDCSPPGASVHGSPQARMLEWVAISFSRGSSRLGDRAGVSCLANQQEYKLKWDYVTLFRKCLKLTTVLRKWHSESIVSS